MLSEDKIEKLLACNKKEIKPFSFDGVVTPCRVYKVYDGDTCSVFFYTKSGTLTRTSVRLHDIDAPEIKPNKSMPETDRQQEIDAGILARDYLSDLVCSDESTHGPYKGLSLIEFGKNDKYGRPLANIYLPKGNLETGLEKGDRVQDLLLAQNLVTLYTGGTKVPYKQWTKT